MKEIALLGFGTDFVFDEQMVQEKGCRPFCYDDLYDIDFHNEELSIMVVSEFFHEDYRDLFDHFLEKRKDIMVFVITDDPDSRYFTMIDDRGHRSYAMRVSDVDWRFLLRLLSFSDEIRGGYQHEGICIDYETSKIFVDEKNVKLRPLEYDLLVYLRFHEERILSRMDIIQGVWGYPCLGTTRTIDAHVKSLRKKLSEYRYLVKTVHGRGYQFIA